MKKGLITVLIIAGAMVALGVLLIFGALIKSAFNMEKMFNDGGNTVEKTYEAKEQIEEIRIFETHGASIDVQTASDGKARVETKEPKGYTFFITEDGGTLSVKAEDDRGLFRLSSPRLIMYLPAGSYDDLSVDSSSGYVKVGDGLEFGTLDIKSVSGSVVLESDVKGDLTMDITSGSVTLNGVKAGKADVKSMSGGITITDLDCDSLDASVASGGFRAERVKADGDIRIKGKSGGIRLNDVTCENLNTENSSGGTKLEDTIVEEDMNIQNSSGSIHLERSDATDLNLRTVSGSIHAELLSNKDFSAKATSGGVTVPDASAGEINGTCTAQTTSGSIRITVK